MREDYKRYNFKYICYTKPCGQIRALDLNIWGINWFRLILVVKISKQWDDGHFKNRNKNKRK